MEMSFVLLLTKDVHTTLSPLLASRAAAPPPTHNDDQLLEAAGDTKTINDDLEMNVLQ
jgi:hypothetical protein